MLGFGLDNSRPRVGEVPPSTLIFYRNYVLLFKIKRAPSVKSDR